MNETKCPNCRVPGSPVPGYLPTGKRCEVCKGIGNVSLIQVMNWELSL